MPVFISKQPSGRFTVFPVVYGSWKRWFAWYPVSEMGVTYWLEWLDYRHVSGGVSIADRPYHNNYYEYRLNQGR